MDSAKNSSKGLKFLGATGNGVRNYQWTGEQEFDAAALAVCYELIEALDKRVFEVMMFETVMTSTLGTVDDILNSLGCPEFFEPEHGLWGAKISRPRSKGVFNGLPIRMQFISQDKDSQIRICG